MACQQSHHLHAIQLLRQGCRRDFHGEHHSRSCPKPIADLEQEANDHAITLHEDDEDAVNAMLEFFYTQDYTLSVGKGDPSGLSFHIVAYHLAGKYMLATTLQELAARKFSANAEEAWPTTAFTDAISKVFELADAQGDALTAAVIRISKENLTLLMENQSGFKKVLAEEPALAAAIVEHTLQKLEAVEEERDAAKKKPERTDRGVKYFKCCHYGCSFGGIGSCTFMLSSMVSRGPLYCPLCGSGHISTSSANERLV